MECSTLLMSFSMQKLKTEYGKFYVSLIESARELIVKLEADLEYPSYNISAPLYVDLIEALRAFVKEYYDVTS